MTLTRDTIIEGKIIKKGTEIRLKESSELNKNFYDWFGNSKIVERGLPKVLYHGTKQRFDTFDKNLISSNTGNYGHYGYGIYFSDDIQEAKTYGSNILECYIRMEKPFYNTKKYLEPYLKDYGVEEIPVAFDKDSLLKAIEDKDPLAREMADLYLQYGYDDSWDKFYSKHDYSERFTLDIDDVLEWLGEKFIDPNSDEEISQSYIASIEKELGTKIKLHYNYPRAYSIDIRYLTNNGEDTRLTNMIIKDGYDGIISGTEYVVFDPNQIKSIDNNGDWSKTNDNIYESKKR